MGIVGGVSTGLGVASTYKGGLSHFLENTAKNYSVLGGAAASLGLSFVVTLTVSLATTTVKSNFDSEIEWLKLRDIDNPLHPWSDLYREDFPDLRHGEKPTCDRLDRMFRKARIAAYVGGLMTIVTLVVVVPSVMMSLHVLDFTQFKIWVYVLQGLCFSMAAVVVFVAPLEEILQILRQNTQNSPKDSTPNDNHTGLEETTHFD